MDMLRRFSIVVSVLAAASLLAEDPARVVVTELPSRYEQQKQLETLNKRVKELSEQLTKRRSIIDGELSVNHSEGARVMKALIDATVLSSYSFSEYFDELAGKRVPLAEAIAEKRDVIKNMEKTLQQIDDFNRRQET